MTNAEENLIRAREIAKYDKKMHNVEEKVDCLIDLIAAHDKQLQLLTEMVQLTNKRIDLFRETLESISEIINDLD